MTHWTSRYIGLPYAENDCAELAARVQREVFCRSVSLPTVRAAGLRGLTAQIEAEKDVYAERTDLPQDGDAVLMVGRGRLDHVGVYAAINGVPHVLHAMRNAGQVCLHRLRELEGIGLKVEGFYRWK